MLQTALITDASAPVQAFVGWVNELIEKYNEGYRPSDSEINIRQKQGYADFQLAAMLHIPMTPVRDYRQLVDTRGRLQFHTALAICTLAHDSDLEVLQIGRYFAIGSSMSNRPVSHNIMTATLTTGFVIE